jgi:hypothetical protein
MCGFMTSPFAQQLHAMCPWIDAVRYVDCGDFWITVRPSWQ